MTDFICQVVLDILAYQNGYGDKYCMSVVDEIQNLRTEICEKMTTANDLEKTNLEKLLYILDNDQNIRSKKGLGPSH